MVCFPLFVDLNDKTALVVGGGPVAARKARVLLDYGPRVLVCAPRFVPELEQLSGAELLRQLDEFRVSRQEAYARLAQQVGAGLRHVAAQVVEPEAVRAEPLENYPRVDARSATYLQRPGARRVEVAGELGCHVHGNPGLDTRLLRICSRCTGKLLGN